MPTAPQPLANVGRRRAARLRVSVPAKLITVTGTQRCLLIDVSRTGAQIALSRPLSIGDAGFLQVGGLELFGSTIREGAGANGLDFDVEMSDEDVLVIRRYAETYQMDERKALMAEARKWVTGGAVR